MRKPESIIVSGMAKNCSGRSGRQGAGSRRSCDGGVVGCACAPVSKSAVSVPQTDFKVFDIITEYILNCLE